MLNVFIVLLNGTNLVQLILKYLYDWTSERYAHSRITTRDISELLGKKCFTDNLTTLDYVASAL